MTVTGATLEEMVVNTPRVISTGSLPLLAGVRGETARLTAVVLRVPEAALVVTVVLTTDETLTTVNISLAVSLTRLTHPHTVPHTAVLPTTALHLQPLQLLVIHHDGQGRLPRGGVLQEGETAHVTLLAGCLVVEGVAVSVALVSVLAVPGTGQHRAGRPAGDDPGVPAGAGDVDSGRVESAGAHALPRHAGQQGGEQGQD